MHNILVHSMGFILQVAKTAPECNERLKAVQWANLKARNMEQQGTDSFGSDRCIKITFCMNTGIVSGAISVNVFIINQLLLSHSLSCVVCEFILHSVKLSSSFYN